MWAIIHVASSHLVRRRKDFDFIAYMKPDNGIGYVSNEGTLQRSRGPPPINDAQLTILVLAGAIVLISIILLEYTRYLLLTLATVEDPPAVYLPINEDTEARNANPEPRQEGDRVFITSSIRGILRHLRREAGIWSPWRGFGPNLIFALTNGLIQVAVVSILKAFMPLSLATGLAGIASMVLLSKLAMVCTHIMITPPEATYWWTRYHKASWAQASKTVPAMLIWATTLQLITEFTLTDPAGIPIVIMLLFLYITILVTILLTRVQASALPDDTPTIVQFEKTFGQDTSDTGGVLTVQKAIKSIDRATFNRVFGFSVKCSLALTAIGVILVGLFVLLFNALVPDWQSF